MAASLVNKMCSEKARIPAWTDRILRKGPNLRQLLYDSAPLRFSDHRPVFAAFECKVSIVDEPHREAISQALYERRKADVGDTTAHAGDGEETEDEDLIGYDSIEPGLPPASSDRQKWWLDNKQPARAQVSVPNGRDGHAMTLNPNRASNPFGHSEEPDWISVPRSSSQASLSSLSSSPYEKVSLPSIMSSSSAANTGPRRMPPPYDPSNLPAKVGRMNLGADNGARTQQDVSGPPPPPPPPPRRQTAGMGTGNEMTGANLNRMATQPLQIPLRPTSAASSNASQLSQQLRAGNAPPPVAKKPAHLATTSPLSTPSPTGTGSIRGFNDGSDSFQPPLPARSSTGMSTDPALTRKPVLPSKPSGPARGQPGAMGGVGLPGMSNGGPALPSRKPVATDSPQQTQSVDLLDSLEEGSQTMGGWETLQPSSRS